MNLRITIALLSLLFVPTVAAADHWHLVGAPGVASAWGDSLDRVRSLATFNDRLYAGLGISSPRIVRFDGEDWEDITGPWVGWLERLGIASEPGLSEVAALATFNGSLYAGLGHKGAALWRYDNHEWTHIGSWPNAESVYSLTEWNGQLLIGFWQGNADGSDGGGKIMTWDGAKLAELSVPWSSDVQWTYTFLPRGDELFVSVVSVPKHGQRISEVWRLDKAGAWQKIGGHGLNGSWNISTRHIATSMTWYNGRLVVGINCQDCETFQHLWQWDGSTWKLLTSNLTCSPDPDNQVNQRSFNAMRKFGKQLYIAGGAASPGSFAAWRYNDHLECTTADTDSEAAWNSDNYGYTFAEFRGHLYMGTLGEVGHVYRLEQPPGQSSYRRP